MSQRRPRRVSQHRADVAAEPVAAALPGLDSVAPVTADPPAGAQVARSALWSGVGSIVLRLGGVIVGIVLARLLSPEQFGVYAVALTVQAILMTVADLGLSADLIRSDDPDRIAPTVAALGLVSGALTTGLTVALSTPLGTLLGSAEAGPAIAVLAFTLLLGGMGVVPYALLLRRFQQRELFFVGVADFVVSTVVTIVLIAAGFGVMSLAIGRVAAQLVSLVLQYVVARVRPRVAIDRRVVGAVLGFGLPIAGANLLAWSLLNVDNVVIARVAGTLALGFYVLAFNVSNWPMSALSQSVRAVSLPYFSRAAHSGDAIARMVSIGWAVALPAGGVLAVLSAPLIEVLYGARWLPAAPVLAALGAYGALRVVFDILTAYLYARGRSRPVLWIQAVWLVALVVAMIAATTAYGIVGAGWVHLIVAGVVILPAYLLALRGAGVAIRPVLTRCAWPTAAAAAAIVTAALVSRVSPAPLLELLLGGIASVLVWAAVIWPWGRREWRSVRAA